LDGAVTSKMSPKGPHARLQFVLARWFEDLAQSPGAAVASTATRATFAGGSLVPDVSVDRSDRVPADEHGVSVALFVDPRRRWVRVFRAEPESGPFTESDRIDLSDVLPGFVLSVAELFRSLRARPD